MQTRSDVAADRLAFLLSRHGQFMNARVRQALSAAGLSPRHGMTLVRLADLGAISQQGLIEFLGVDPSGLVAILNDLEREGLAERRRDPADRRRHIVEITPAGAKAVRTVERSIAEVEREAFVDLTDDEILQLRSLLGRVKARHDVAGCGE